MLHFNKRNILALGGFCAVIFAGAAASAVITADAIPEWYAALKKPAFNPPDAVFGPVWTCLYFLMAVSAWLVWQNLASKNRTRAMAVFWVQLALNFAWSFIFFGAKLPGIALFELLLLWASILAMIVFFRQESRIAAWMQAPYLCWVTFAAVLNFKIWQLN